MNYSLDNLLKKPIKNGWLKYIESEKDKEYFKKILEKINNDSKKYENKLMIFPFPKNVFRSFRYFEPEETKIVLLGQDPYIRYENIKGKIVPQAMGLSFSVPKKIKKIPPSLQNIYKEIKKNNSNFEIPNHGNITRWAKKEKILLLNSALTVVEGHSGSHLKYWEKFTDNLIHHLSENYENIIFLLLGNFAIKKTKLINSDKHQIIKATHPSPLSAHRGFFNSDVFKNVDNTLLKVNKKKISFYIKKK